MKSSPALLLIAASTVGVVVAACTATPDSGVLGRTYDAPPPSSSGSSGGTTSSSGGQGGSSGSSSGSTASSSGTTSSGGTTSGGSTSGSSSSGGSSGGATVDAGSMAEADFVANVYPLLTVCQGCHVKGNAQGAPAMMDSPATTAYAELDALGLIQTNSQLLTQGSHDTGAAPALTSAQTAAITTWLSMEAQENAGGVAPTSVLTKVAGCASQTAWNAIGWGFLTTVPRIDENPEKCTGCNGSLCASCHDSGEYGFYMAEGSQIEPAGTTFQQTFQGTDMPTYIIKYFGLNGTAPVASNAISLKQTAVAAGPAYSHPMFVMPQTMVNSLNAFVTNAITCAGGSADAGTEPDGAP